MRMLMALSMVLGLGDSAVQPVNLNVCSAADARNCTREWQRCINACANDKALLTRSCMEWCRVLRTQCRRDIGCADW
jgi:hypothetical protein